MLLHKLSLIPFEKFFDTFLECSTLGRSVRSFFHLLFCTIYEFNLKDAVHLMKRFACNNGLQFSELEICQSFSFIWNGMFNWLEL